MKANWDLTAEKEWSEIIRQLKGKGKEGIF